VPNLYVSPRKKELIRAYASVEQQKNQGQGQVNIAENKSVENSLTGY